MKFEEHCEESERLFGKPWDQVHHWLDEWAGKPGVGMKHRRYRHHLEGVYEAGSLFGEEAMRAARQHIISDLKQEGWLETDHFPRNEQEYVKMGLY